jgi:hypothetical protein
LAVNTARTRIHTNDGTLTGKDFFYHPGSFGKDADPDTIPHGEEIAFASALF